ncbi:MAG TPA: fibronectin type III domain-containing protein [Ginsengibacter sp.]
MKQTLLFRLIAVCILSFAFFGNTNAQVTKSAFSFGAPKIINIKQIAEYEKNNPVTLTPRFIEQGEDRDKFILKPGPVDKNAKVHQLVQTQAANQVTLNSPVASQNFQGILDNGTLIPPDINGAVGTSYVVETTNQQFNIYNKSSGSLHNTLSITSFFSASGLYNFYDPHITYDPNNDRFIIGIDAQTGTASSSPSAFAVAISQTGDPTGNWYVYTVVCTPSAPTDFMDYDQLGFNNNWIVMTGNDFPASGANKSYIYVWPRATLYSGGSGTATTFTDLTNLLLSPATTCDASQNTLYLVSDRNGNSGGNGYVNIASITGTSSSPVYNAGSQLGINQPWKEPTTLVKAPESGETAAHGIECGDTRIHSVIYKNGSLWFTHTVFLPATGTTTHSGVDWWQINPSSLTVLQFDRIADANSKIWYYYPSLNVNANNDMLVGYSSSSSTTFAGAQYALRLAADAQNTVETPVQYVNGLAGYYKTYGGGRNRWGDYSGTAFDPVDGSFWTFQEWANTGNNWGTQIAHIPASGAPPVCNTPGSLTTTAITNTSATLGWASVSGAASYNVQYRVVGTSTWTSVNIATNSYNATGLTAGTNYEWQVQTVCSGTSTSAFTASVNFTTTSTCAMPGSLTTSGITNTGATFGWGAVTGATGYNVRYRIVGTSTWSTAAATNSYSATGLTAGTNYEWQVQTICSGSTTSAFTGSTTFTTTGGCSTPTGLSSSAITTTTATVGWTAVSGATGYNLQYKVSTAGSFTTISNLTATSYNLTGLTAATIYQFQVQAICSGGNSAYSSASSFTTSSGSITYCASKGITTYEYINKVALGSISNTSGNNGGYGDYTALSTNLTAGSTYTITMTPGFASTKYAESWTVYIDYNQDGTLNGTGETVLKVKSTKTGTASGSFKVPTTAKNGATRLRIQMNYGSYSTNPCATLTYGEVEDYTVNISGGASPLYVSGDTPGLQNEIISNTLSVIPNPLSGRANATAVYNLAKTGNTTLKVVDLEGRSLYSVDLGLQSAGQHNYLLSNVTNRLSSGYYVVVLVQDGHVISNNRLVIGR